MEKRKQVETYIYYLYCDKCGYMMNMRGHTDYGDCVYFEYECGNNKCDEIVHSQTEYPYEDTEEVEE